ncbi:kinase-like domain-containing protein [Rhizophagus clarus]|uniref:Kinase-like domain-containing protein n=1 Tax=Rhizophagus clarus TaxID=94130 RepID=A0A8H3KV51_9GLOM|nr:kinase-like domain-containing protein [Rhizophagus clarus]
MIPIRQEFINDAIKEAFTLEDSNIHNNNIDRKHEFLQQIILNNNFLTNEEKSEATRILNVRYDRDRILFINNGGKKICKLCKLERLCAMHCENCIRIYLETNFSNWTSGNNNVDDLIKRCQRKSLAPHMVVEWIPYNNLQNIKYLKKGGYSDIYTADWIGGRYIEWDFQQRELIRFGTHEVILKRLVNIESANRSWFEEAESHLTIGSKWVDIVPCYGITLDPSTNDYMLVLHKMDNDLRTHLRQNHNKLTWKKEFKS